LRRKKLAAWKNNNNVPRSAIRISSKFRMRRRYSSGALPNE